MIPVHVYRADLRRVSAEAAYLVLDSTERQRASATNHPRVKAEFVKTRALLRFLLAGIASKQPGDFTFANGESGKPYLADDDTLHFNVSHASGMALIAVARCPVGIDVERVDDSLDHSSLAASVFSSVERDLVLNAPRARRSDVFFSLWTRKEAYLKATGCGFSSNLGLISTASPDGKIEDRSQPPYETPWYVFSLPAPENFKAALVARSRNLDVSISDVTDILSAGYKRPEYSPFRHIVSAAINV